jgi:hypothetical protein
MNLTVKITEQVKNKLEAVLRGKYDDRTVWMYYKVSLQMLRDIIENLIACYHTTHPLTDKDLYYDQNKVQIVDWIQWIQNRTSSDKLVDLDRLLSKLIKDKAENLVEALTEENPSDRMTTLSMLQMSIQMAVFTEVQHLIKSPIVIQFCKENGWTL